MEINFKYLDVNMRDDDIIRITSVIESKYCSLINNVIFEIINNRFHSSELNYIRFNYVKGNEFAIVSERVSIKSKIVTTDAITFQI